MKPFILVYICRVRAWGSWTNRKIYLPRWSGGALGDAARPASSRFPEDSPVMKFLVGQSKTWKRQPSMTAHNKSIKTYDILGKTNSKRQRHLNGIWENLLFPSLRQGWKTNSHLHQQHNQNILCLSQLNLLPNIYFFLTESMHSYINKNLHMLLYIFVTTMSKVSLMDFFLIKFHR